MSDLPLLYYVRWDSQELGPFSAEIIQRMIQAGGAEPTLQVRRQTEVNWYPVGALPEFDGLFGRQSRPRLRTRPETPNSKRQAS